MLLTKQDLEYLHLKLLGELLTYFSHKVLGNLKPGREQVHCQYLEDLDDRLTKTIAEM